MFGCGLRRAEAVAVEVEHYDPESGASRVVGKGNCERTIYAMNGGGQAKAEAAKLVHVPFVAESGT